MKPGPFERASKMWFIEGSLFKFGQTVAEIFKNKVTEISAFQGIFIYKFPPEMSTWMAPEKHILTAI